MKPNNTDDLANEKELLRLKEKLGIDPTVSPDQLRDALKGMVNNKSITGYKVKKEK
ncbi:hypothetical protein [Paenibacillus thermotolerans]|uniref:hypothetical protein n=1 Tax=Paenibacillus thermotolerans TaxID=3027807 RepID=UPI0023680C91|nr:MULTISPECIES: hypothetical protein [unclassified Paenibacillus]